MSYITLDGKRYYTISLETRRKKSQSTGVSLSGKTLSQTFAFTDMAFVAKLRVYHNESDPNYGDLDDLRAAYAQGYVPFVDLAGSPSIDVFIEGELPEMDDLNRSHPGAPLEITLALRKRQV